MTKKPSSPDNPGSEKPRRFVVRGQVRRAGRPVAHATVEIYDQHMRGRKPLGKTSTGDDGSYERIYTEDELSSRVKAGAGLVVSVLDDKGQVVVESAVLFDAGPELTVDLAVAEGPRSRSEYDELVEHLAPILQAIERNALKDDDVPFLAGQTGFDAQYITWLAEAARRHREADAIAESAFYGLFRQGLPTSLADLVDRDWATLRDALERSARGGIIPLLSGIDLDEIGKRFFALKGQLALKPADPTHPSSLGDLLTAARVSSGKQRAVADLHVAHSGPSATFWQALDASRDFSRDEMDAIRFALQLGDLTKRHLPLVLELQRRAAAGATGPTPGTGRSQMSAKQYVARADSPAFDLRQFAGLDVDDWKEILRRPRPDGKAIGTPQDMPGANEEERLNSYAKSLSDHLESALPTAAIATRLAKDTGDDSPFSDLGGDLQTFFANNPAFDFRTASVDMYLEDDRDQKLEGVADTPALTTTLRSMQRVFNVSPRYADIRTLLADDLHSALSIVHVGARTFVERYADPLGGPTHARDVYRRAEQVHTTAVSLFVKHSAASNSPLPYAIGGEAPEPPALPAMTMRSKAPNLTTLFGSLDLCDCEHCQSLYSPAAYFVDIMRFLGDGPTKEGMTPLQALLLRRPDLEHIELTCENTLTPLPYVDLVNEILEAGAEPRMFEIAEGPDIATVLGELRNSKLPAGLTAAFAAKGWPLTDAASVRVDAVAMVDGEAGDATEWNILDTGWAFSLKYQGRFEGFRVLPWPQTSWTAAELRARPEHIHAPAYDPLRAAVYPWNLPLNLPIEEMRSYLRHLGVPRHELMRTFYRDDPSDVWSDASIAVEHLGLTPEAARVIAFEPEPPPLPDPWICWGLLPTDNQIDDPTDGTAQPATGDWDVVLQRVSILLHQSGLSYQELLELLGSRFINPLNGTKRTLGIRAAKGQPAATCTLSKLEVVVDDEAMSEADQKATIIAVWHRLHRFVRLWRALKWTARDVDKAIAAFRPTTHGELDITQDFLIELSHVERVRAQVRLPVVTLLSWWADIDTQSYADHLKDGSPSVPSLYSSLFTSRSAGGQSLPDPPAPGGLISANAAAITAGLQISAQDFALLRNDPNVLPLTPGGAVDDELTLRNLSRLHRHASLARALRLPVRAYLSTLELVTADPFATTTATVEYLRQIERIRTSGFTVEDLDYLLRHQFRPGSRVAITDKEVAAVLDEMRSGLRAIASENTFVDAETDPDAATTDPSGTVTRQKLSLLNWDAAVIDQVVAVLSNTFTYATDLPVVDPGVVIPEELNDRVSYDDVAGQLRFTGTMTPDQRTLLTDPPNTDATFRAAVTALFNAPRAVVIRHMGRYSVPTSETGLDPVPPDFRIPDALKGKCYYDTVTRRLHFVGIMTEAERRALDDVSTEQAYRTAIGTLFLAPTTTAGAPASADVFLRSTGAGNELDALFGDPETQPAARFVTVLGRLLPHLRGTLSERLVTQRLAETLQLEPGAMNALLTRWIDSSAQATQRAIADFTAPSFAESNSNIASTPKTFPAQFAGTVLLHKISVLSLRFGFTTQQLGWLFEFGAGNWLDVRTLPPAAVVAGHARFKGWAALADLARLRDALPQGERLLTEVFTEAGDPGTALSDLFEMLSTGAGWDVASLQALCGAGGFTLGVDAFRNEAALLRLSDAFRTMARLGASAASCLSWTAIAPTDTESRQAAGEIRALVRANHDADQWLEVAKALHDPLRARQRSALVAYLVAQERRRDADALYENRLIDVEMAPCMMTTRIKQAISTVQLFVQRALMNLEDDVALTPAEAREWSQWRKQYRVWEANRKVFLYPENWIEPELRDDKSPFYEDLEDELLQSDVTEATAEDAFLHYLEKLDQVSRLDIVGMYRQIENFGPEVLHVVGRTHGVPHVYFYRRLEGGFWSAWEKVDLDIEGDHIMPVVWNRRVHMFWATFMEKSHDATKEQRDRNEEPGRFWAIKMAWSENRNGKWMPTKVSKDALVYDKHPSEKVPQAPQDFSFKTRIQFGPAGEQLSFQCYGTKTIQPPTPAAPAPITSRRDILPTLTQTDILGAPIETFAKFTMTIDGRTPLPSQTKKTWVQIEKNSDNSFVERVSFDRNGSAESKGFIEPVNCYLVSEEFALAHFDFFMFVKPLRGGIGLSIDLVPWSPPDPDEVPVPDAEPVPMQGIGEFTLDDYNGMVLVTPGPVLLNSLSPANLEPIFGTNIQSMALVEPRYSAGMLGADSVLARTPGASFSVLLAHQGYTPRKFTYPFFFQDEKRTYFAALQKVDGPGIANSGVMLRFNAFYHPRIADLILALRRKGVGGLLTRDNQRLTDGASQFRDYLPNFSLVDNTTPDSLPKADVDFSDGGAYAKYNWELFFHTPFLIAIQLSSNQRFEEAQRWFHYIFDPTATDSPDRPANPGTERFWRVKPFYEVALRGVHTLEELIWDDEALAKQVKSWRENPFKPHAIARSRHVAYMKAVVMRYIDNLIAWGDQLFRRDTIESINEATQLYVLAGKILGRRPEAIPPRAKPRMQTFRTLDDRELLDSLSNAVVAIEDFLAPSVAPLPADDDTADLQRGAALTMPFFCLTANDKLLGYWDTVADRLFKIRHCMNIEGVVRSLPMFEPPIDPGMLVRAAAAGVDLASVLGDMNAPIPHYRFNVMVQKASELCTEVKALGAGLLGAVEKRDAEALALLRSGHEVDLLKAVRAVKEYQVEEASDTHQGLIKYQAVVTARQEYYRSRPFLNPFETAHIGLTTSSLVPMAAQAGAEMLAGILHLIPDVKLGFPMTVGATYGGSNIAGGIHSFGSATGTFASMLNTAASLSATLGSYQRRQEDWSHQADLATKELEQIKKQIAAAEVRSAIAERELQNHDLQVENVKAAHAYMRDKFTNRELYNWMVGQISGFYFQSYQLAYDVAKRAERTYRYELGLKDSSFVEFGYWDSLKKGLLAGERLHHDLRRMDVAYLDQNKREYEITKHVSLNALDPISVLKLKHAGECFVNVPEAIFDLDYPGHYLRRLKSVSVTIPCVAGPYASVNCILTQHNSTVRRMNTLLDDQYGRQGDDDPRFADTMGAVQAIVTSSGQNDSGLFETNLRDERYLPFEGKGAVAAWRIELPRDFPAFDHDTISDVVLHLRYTAREGGEQLRKAAAADLIVAVNEAVRSAEQQGLVRTFSLRHEFPSEWYRFMNPPAGQTDVQFMPLNLEKARFPFLLQSKTIALTRMRVFIKVKPERFDAFVAGELKVALASGTGLPTDVLELHDWKKLARADFETTDELGDWTLAAWREVTGNAAKLRIDPTTIDDIVVACGYAISQPQA